MKVVIWNNSETGILAIGTPAYNDDISDSVMLKECLYRWHPDGVEGKDYQIVDDSIFHNRDRANRSKWKVVNGQAVFD